MNAMAVIFRLLSLLSLVGLAGVLWLKWQDQTHQTHSFLDEVVSSSYDILQSERETQWKDIGNKKNQFSEVFDSNDPVGQNDENPLEAAVATLRSAEDVLLRNPEYRDTLDSRNMEYGAESLIWNSESKLWQPNPAVKLSPPAGFKDPFSDETQFPKQDVKNEDGTVTKGVPRDFRLRTVIGMLYKDRHDKFGEISKLRSMIVARDQELREYQNLFAKEKELKEQLEDQIAKLTVEFEETKANLALEKEERELERQAAEEKQRLADQRIVTLEDEKATIQKRMDEERDSLLLSHKEEVAALRDEIREADANGYKRGIDEMVTKQQGAEIDEGSDEDAVNPFLPSEEGPPQLTQSQLILAAQANEIGELGVPSTVARIDFKAGMMLIPLGTERGVQQGNVFTLWKDKRKTARIRVQSSRQGFSLAYILPKFGSPKDLRPGDNVHVVPEIEETL